MKKVTTLIYALALLNFFSFTTHAQTITQLSFYSSISVFDMQYLNNHLVVSQNGLLIFDVTNPSRIQLVSQSAFPDGIAHRIAAQGNYAYMAEGNNGLFAVYNISNFNAPFLTGSVSIRNATGGLAPHGNYVYITGIDSVFVVDVSNPSSPQVVKRVFMSQAGIAGGGVMRINGHSLFIMTTSSLKVFDISNPANPVFTTSIAFSHYSEQGLSADTINHRLFLPWITPVEPQFMGYDAYDVSNPSSPVFLFRDSTAYGGGGFGISAYSYTNNVLFLSEFATIEAFDASSANHKFLTSFHGTAIANGIVAMDAKDSVFFDAKGGGIEVLKYTPAAATCNVPAGLTTANITSTNAVLSWTAVSGALSYNLQWKAASSGTWTTVPGITTTSYNLTGLSSHTNYQFKVQTICSSGSSAYSSPASFRTSGGSKRLSSTEPSNTLDISGNAARIAETNSSQSISYCTSRGTNTSLGYINEVKLSCYQYTCLLFDNKSGNNGGYGDFTKIEGDVVGGARYSLDFTPGYIGGNIQPEYFTIFIDWNHDGVFESGELVGQKSIVEIRKNILFVVPTTALNGTTRMRIIMQKGSLEFDPCATFTYGEVEDYTIDISGNAAQLAETNPDFKNITGENTAGLALYPNPAKDNLTVVFTGSSDGNIKMNVYNLLGQKVMSIGNLSVKGSNIFNLNTGKLGSGFYILEIKNNGLIQRQKFLISR